MSLRVITAPTAVEIEAFVSLDEAKIQLRIDHGDHDATITRLIRTALEQVEAEVQRRYLTQDLEWVRPDWCGLRLPLAPVASVTSIKYRDADNAEQTLDPDDYRVRPSGRGVVITEADHFCFPFLGDHAEPVVIRFTAGTAAEAVPPSVKDAVLLKVQALYDQKDLDVCDLLVAERWT